MSKDIINAPALAEMVEQAVAAAPKALRPFCAGIRTCLRREAEAHFTVTRARRRRADPPWAQAKFEARRPLHRFDEVWGDALAKELRETVGLLAEVATAAARGGSATRRAVPFLRSLPHRKEGRLAAATRDLLRDIEGDELLADPAAPIHPPLDIALGSLTAHRCASVAEVRRLGHEARNCLADDVDVIAIARGVKKVWALRDGPRLLAVVTSQDGRAVEAKGPRNAPIGLHDVRDVARLISAAGLAGGEVGLHAQFAGEPVLVPTAVETRDRWAYYCEWRDAALLQVDDVGESHRLALSFDPDLPLAVAYADRHTDPRHEVAQFGRKRLRRIMKEVANRSAAPTLVQHRLLALSC